MKLNDILLLGGVIENLRMNAAMAELEFRNIPILGRHSVVSKLKGILLLLDENSISQQTQDEINKMISQLEEAYEEIPERKGLLDYLASSDKDPRFYLQKNDATRFHKKIEIWTDRIISEVKKQLIFPAHTKGDLNIEKLIQGVESFFPSEVWVKIQQIEKDDLEDCIKCLLTKRWTPSTIMAMRAIESAVRKYYNDLTGKKKKNWWKILDELKDNPDANKKLVKELDYIREHIRNPLAHPEERIENYEEAEIAFIHAKKALNQIYS